MLETTGLADPGPIASMFWLDEELCSDLQLDGVITLIDAKYCLRHLSEVRPQGTINECVQQVALADVIVLNKCDLVTTLDLTELRQKLSAINSMAKVLETTYSKVDLHAILDLNAYKDSPGVKFDSVRVPEIGNASHHLDLSVTTATLEIAPILNLEKVYAFLENLLWEKNVAGGGGCCMEILRLKGLVLGQPGEAVMIQAVHEIYDKTPVSVGATTDKSRFIFIGKNLDKAVLLEKLLQCV